MPSKPLITPEQAKKLEEKNKAAARKKALALAAAAAAAAAVPIAAEVIVKKSEAAEPKTKPADPTVPEPPRYEYSKPRQAKGLNELIKEKGQEIQDWIK